MNHTLDDTLNAIRDSQAVFKHVFYNHKGYVILWFDRSGYSVTDHTYHPNSHGTTGILSYDKALDMFKQTVDELLFE